MEIEEAWMVGLTQGKTVRAGGHWISEVDVLDGHRSGRLVHGHSFLF